MKIMTTKAWIKLHQKNWILEQHNKFLETRIAEALAALAAEQKAHHETVNTAIKSAIERSR